MFFGLVFCLFVCFSCRPGLEFTETPLSLPPEQDWDLKTCLEAYKGQLNSLKLSAMSKKKLKKKRNRKKQALGQCFSSCGDPPTHKIISLLLCNHNFITVMNSNVNYLICDPIGITIQMLRTTALEYCNIY